MDTEKNYTDGEGNKSSLFQMVKHEPEWAEFRIKEGEKAIAELESIKSKEFLVVPFELIKAVAHIGVDFGYGVYKLEQKHINTARRIYEANT